MDLDDSFPAMADEKRVFLRIVDGTNLSSVGEVLVQYNACEDVDTDNFTFNSS